MRSNSSVVGSVMALALLAGTVAAQTGPRAGKRGPGPMAGEMRYLQLTDEQRAAVESALEAQRAQVEALRESMQANRAQLREALDNPSPDPVAVGEIVIDGEKLRKEERALRDEAQKALGSVLTPEQKQRLEVLEAARALGRGRGSGGPGMPPPGEGPGPEPPR